MALIAKAKKKLHSLMKKMQSEHKCIDFNFIRLEDPTEYIVCSPEGDMQSFKHLMKGDFLMYFEAINSTPLEDDGYTVKDVRLIGLCRNSDKFVFTKDSVFKFVDTVGEANVKISHAWATEDTVNGMKVWYACGLMWLDANQWHSLGERDILWLHPDLSLNYRRCCICGCISHNNDGMCSHLKENDGPIARNRCVMSIKKVFRLYISYP